MSKAQELKPELLPCPFCGSKAKMSHSRDAEVCNVRCSGWSVGSCLGAGPNCYTEAEAIAGWNRRAPANSEQQAAQQDEGEVISDLAYALDMLVGKNAAHSLCIHEPMDAMGRVKGTWSAAAEVNARATLKLHASVIIAARASNGGKA